MPRRTLQDAREASEGFWEGIAQDRAEARAEAEGQELTERMQQPGRSVSAKAGRMERESPLFFGQGDNPTLF